MAEHDEWALEEPSDERQLTLAAAKRRKRRVGAVRWLPSGKRSRRTGDDRVEVRFHIKLPNGAPYVVRKTCAPEQLEEVRSKLHMKARDLAVGLESPELTLTLAEVAARYRREPGASWTAERESTWRLLRSLHKQPIAAVTASAVAVWAKRSLWTGDGRAPRGSGKASKAYIRHAYELLRLLVRWAAEPHRGILSRDPLGAQCPGVAKSSHAASKKRPPIAGPDIARLLRAARQMQEADPRLFDLHLRAWLLLHSGVRPVQLRAAKRADLRDAHTVDRAAPIGAGMLRLAAAKGGHQIEVPLESEIYRALLTHHRALPTAAQSTGLLFPVLHKHRWSMRSQWIESTTWRRMCEVGELPKPWPVSYQSRHTRLTDVTNDPRMGIRTAQALAGHTDSRTTERSYANPMVNLPRAVYERGVSLRNAMLESEQPEPPEPPSGTDGPSAPRKGQEKDNAKNGSAPRNKPMNNRANKRVKPAQASLAGFSAQPGNQAIVLPSEQPSHLALSESERVDLFAYAAACARMGVAEVARKLLGYLGPADAARWANEVQSAELLVLGAEPAAALESLSAHVLELSRSTIHVPGSKPSLSLVKSGT